MSTPTALDRLTDYLRSTGWASPAEPGPSGRIWLHPESGVGLPVPSTLTATGIDWEQILHRLARIEGVDERTLASRLTGDLVDVANLRASNDIVIGDTIPYLAAVSLVRDSWVMLRSSATTSRGPKGHIRRYRKAADEIAELARMAHTKRGSFVIPILMPIPEAPEPAQEPLPQTDTAFPESDERRVMRTFAEALSAIDRVAVQPERDPTQGDMAEMIRSGVSHEFSAALVRILGQPAVSEFSATFEWAPGPGHAPATPSRVEIPAAALERVSRISTLMKSETAKREIEILTGPVVGVHRDDDDQSGVVTVQTMRNARIAHVTVNVSRDRLYEALDWMKSGETVSIEGRVHRAGSGLQSDRRDGVVLLRSRQLP